MTDHLYFGEDTTELRVQNELNQRNFTKAISQHFDVTIQDAYDVLQGFCTKIFAPVIAEQYFSWLLSTEWYSCSLKLREMTKESPEIVRKFIDLSMAKYPDAWKDERIREIIAKSS